MTQTNGIRLMNEFNVILSQHGSSFRECGVLQQQLELLTGFCWIIAYCSVLVQDIAHIVMEVNKAP